MDKGKDIVVEQFHTPGSFHNSLAWGDRNIPEPIEELDDLKSIAYNWLRKVIVRRMQERKRVDVDNFLIYTIEEPLLNTRKAKLNELVAEGVEISHATIGKSKFDET
jgi:hypothetical protein